MKIPSFLLKAFSKVDPLEVAQNELLVSRLELLRAETGVEYSIALVEYNKKRVSRLESYIAKISAKAANGG